MRRMARGVGARPAHVLAPGGAAGREARRRPDSSAVQGAGRSSRWHSYRAVEGEAALCR